MLQPPAKDELKIYGVRIEMYISLSDVLMIGVIISYITITRIVLILRLISNYGAYICVYITLGS